MFSSCTNLTTAPELPATNLAIRCYKEMFSSCINLIATPKLNATTLVDECYKAMFNSCSKLNQITMLATDISASQCLGLWVGAVSTTGTFIKSASMDDLPSGSSGIPSGWTIVDYTE